jgi:hypothetical protein
MSVVGLNCCEVPSQIADVWILTWKSETTQHSKARKVRLMKLTRQFQNPVKPQG